MRTICTSSASDDQGCRGPSRARETESALLQLARLLGRLAARESLSNSTVGVERSDVVLPKAGEQV
jgi:hypothetical protein